MICNANAEIIDKQVITKQASDLHTNNFSQRVLYQYLLSNSLDEHIIHICKAYKKQKDCMLAWIDKELPEGKSSIKLLNFATSKNVAFVPGVPFYTNCKDINTLRMNFTNSSFEDIEKGVKLFASSIKEIL